MNDQSPGSYTISEDDPAGAGYVLTGISCVDSVTGQTFPGSLTSRSVDLNLTTGERVHCTFTNTKLGTVVIKKSTAPSGGSGFSFSGSLGDFSLDDGGEKVVGSLLPGSYSVSENDPSGSGYELSGLSCADSVKGGKRSSGDVGSRTASVNLDPGETVTCTFTNTEDDTITIEKMAIPGGSETFDFNSTLGDFALGGGDVKEFTKVAPGTYTITEEAPLPGGYRLTGISCVDSATGQVFGGDVATGSVTLNLTPGERVHCIFTNERDVAPTPTPVQLFFPMIMGQSYPTPLFDNGFPAIPLRPGTTGEIFFNAPIVLNRATLPAGGRFYFSSAAHQLEPMWVDDLIVVVKNGVDLFQYDFGAPPAGGATITAAGILRITPLSVEVPRSVVEEMAAGGTTLEYRDFYGAVVGASAVWLLWVP